MHLNRNKLGVDFKEDKVKILTLDKIKEQLNMKKIETGSIRNIRRNVLYGHRIITVFTSLLKYNSVLKSTGGSNKMV